MIFLYSVLTIGLDLIIWRVPSLVGNAVAASLVGLLFGPWYPICMRQAGLVLPPRMIAVRSISFCGSVPVQADTCLALRIGCCRLHRRFRYYRRSDHSVRHRRAGEQVRDQDHAHRVSASPLPFVCVQMLTETLLVAFS